MYTGDRARGPGWSHSPNASSLREATVARPAYCIQYTMMRDNLAGDIAHRTRRLIADGRLSAGQRINESRLAARLDVSRTPLREALSRLAAEGFVTVRPRRGFFVQALGAEELRQLYEIRGILDPAALELAGLPSPVQLERLAGLNGRILEAVGDVDAIISRDDAWHEELLSHCPNRIVLDLIRQYMLRTRPLERAYMAEHSNVEVTVREHERIIAALRRGDLAAGVEALRGT